MADIVEAYGICKRCQHAISSEDELARFRGEPYHRNCLPTYTLPKAAHIKCRCTGTGCKHHGPGQQCPNEAEHLIAPKIDTCTGTPRINTESGLCQQCFENWASGYEGD